MGKMRKRGWYIVGVIALIEVIGILLGQVNRRYLLARFQETTGIVIQAATIEPAGDVTRYGDPIAHFRTGLTVDYKVDGRSYQKQLVSQWRVRQGGKVTILYRRDNPSDCMLEE